MTHARKRILPPEIWVNIFGFATCEPGALEAQLPQILQSPDLARPESRKYRNAAYKSSISVKCTLVQVCKAWQSLAMVNRYEDVRLPYEKDNENITSYLHALISRTWNGRPIGSFTKRVDISWHYLQHAEEGNDADLALIQFLRTCPQLSIFIVDGWIDAINPERLACLVAALGDKPLCRLRFVHYGAIPLDSLYSIPSLTTLSIPLRSNLPEIPPAILPIIASLTLNLSVTGRIVPLHFPNLQQLCIIVMTTPAEPNSFGEMVEFIERNGKEVLSLQIEKVTGLLVRQPKYHRLRDVVRPIISSLPNLKELTLEQTHIDGVVNSLDEVSLCFKGITTLGLVAYDEPLLNSVRSFKAVFPDLSTIQFSCEVKAAYRVKNARPFKKAAELGIRVYDGNWRLLNSSY